MKEETKNDPCVCLCCFRRKKKDEDEEAGDEEAPPPTEEPAEVEPSVPDPAEEPLVTHANAVVVGIEENSYFGTPDDYQTETEDDVSKYWPSKGDEKEKAGQASLPTYRDVAFIEGDVFFDADDLSSSIKK